MGDRPGKLTLLPGEAQRNRRRVTADYPDYRFYDTLAASRRCFGRRLPNHQLQTVAAACGYDLTRHHHALADAEACAQIALKILTD